MKPCANCGRPFEPDWLGGLKKWSRLCAVCSVRNLAMFFEHVEPGDTLKDISHGEQIGAWLRDKGGLDAKHD